MFNFEVEPLDLCAISQQWILSDESIKFNYLGYAIYKLIFQTN